MRAPLPLSPPRNCLHGATQQRPYIYYTHTHTHTHTHRGRSRQRGGGESPRHPSHWPVAVRSLYRVPIPQSLRAAVRTPLHSRWAHTPAGTERSRAEGESYVPRGGTWGAGRVSLGGGRWMYSPLGTFAGRAWVQVPRGVPFRSPSGRAPPSAAASLPIPSVILYIPPSINSFLPEFPRIPHIPHTRPNPSAHQSVRFSHPLPPLPPAPNLNK